jgi:hypothetical protein
MTLYTDPDADTLPNYGLARAEVSVYGIILLWILHLIAGAV